MRNLDEVRNNAKLSIKALFYLIGAQTGYKCEITNLDYADLVFPTSPHDLDGYEYFVTVKFYHEVGDPDGTVIGKEIGKIHDSIYPIIDDIYLDGNGKIKKKKGGFMEWDNLFHIQKVEYEFNTDPSLEVTFNFIFNVLFYED